MISLDDTLAVLEDKRLVLYAIIRWQPSLGLPEGHRASAGVETYTEILRGLDLAIQVVPVFEHISVIENRRTTGKREFSQSNQRTGAGGLLVRACPDPILGLEPREKIVVLRSNQVARESLIKVMMSIDEPRENDLPGKVEHRFGRRGELFVRTDLLDETVFDVNSSVLQFPALAVHGDQDFGVLGKKCGHVCNRDLGVPVLAQVRKGANGSFLFGYLVRFVQIFEILLYLSGRAAMALWVWGFQRI